MATDSMEVAELQRAAAYVNAEDTIRIAGMGGVFFGMLVLLFFAGYVSLVSPVDPIYYFAATLGIVLMGSGLSCIIKRSLLGLQGLGFGMIALGISGLAVSLLGLLYLRNLPTFDAASVSGLAAMIVYFSGMVLGVYSIVGGVIALRRVEKLKVVVNAAQPSPESLEWIIDAVKDLLPAEPKTSSGVIAFRVGPIDWKAKLAGPAILLVSRYHWLYSPVRVHFESRQDVQMTDIREKGTRAVRANIHAGALTDECVISRGSMERFQQWKGPSFEGNSPEGARTQ